MKKSALIRVDGAKHLGMGHVVRCLNFAGTLQNHGVESTFIIRDFKDNVVDRIKSAGFKVLTIDKDIGIKQDALITAELAESSDALCIIVDLSNEENLSKREEFVEYFEILKTTDKFLVALDDFNKVDFPFDLQVIPYYGAEDISYTLFRETKYLLGCSYYIAAPDLVKKVKTLRGITEIGRKILVTIGGSDPSNLTVDTARALGNLDIPDLAVKFILGVCFEKSIKEQISNILKDFKGSYELCCNNNIPEMMMWSDLVITGVGLTRYEAALTGTPNLCLTRQNLEVYRNDKFITAGTSSHLTVPDSTCFNRITEEVRRLLKGFDARKKMRRIGKDLIDGGGAERIIVELEKGILN